MKPQRQKSKIEGIFPLNFLQQALLFHSLHEKHDQGFLQVECVLQGKLDPEIFRRCWLEIVKRHESLRTSVHWKDIEKPVQVVHSDFDSAFSFFDWSRYSSSKQERKLTLLREEKSAKNFDLSTAPKINVNLVKLGVDSHVLLWDCHHIFADGWSAAIILKELLAFYEVKLVNDGPMDQRIPPSRKDYLNFVKNQDFGEAELFWKEYLNGFEKPALVAADRGDVSHRPGEFRSRLVSLSTGLSRELRDFAKSNRVTLSTLTHGMWAVILSRFLESRDIAFGTIVSGRSIGLPNADILTGMYMNVLPVRVKTESDQDFSGWLKILQQSLAEIRTYEYVELDRILAWNRLPAGNLMFDSLIVFENIPVESIAGGGLSVEEFSSDVTTTYPLTLAVRPGSQIEFYIKYDSNFVSPENVVWWSKNLEFLAETIIAGGQPGLKELLSFIPHPVVTDQPRLNASLSQGNDFVGPANETEIELASIWEEFFEGPVSATSNFFDIGGSSLTAVRMFDKISSRFGRNIPVTVLLESPTIRELARIIGNGKEKESSSSLVPLRQSGSKPPIFCMHSGGAHILYYKAMSDYLDPEQPVYGIQPVGLDGSKLPQKTVPEMAAHYLNEIRKVQPSGPYIFVGYCFSNSVCVEMALQLQRMGENNSRIIIIDSHPMFLPHNRDLLPTFWEKIRSYKHLVRRRDWNEIFQRSRYRFTTAAEKVKNRILPAPVLNLAEKTLREGKKPDLREIQHLLGKAYDDYVWESFDVPLTLILAGDPDTHPWTRVVIDQWESLAKRDVECHFVPGSHMTLFDEPAVKGLAARLQKCLDSELQEDAA